jgi:hypothetical protein
MLTKSLLEPQTSQAKCVEHTVQPDISIYKALRSRFILDQVTYIVGDCSSDVFKRFITACCQAAFPSKHWKSLHQQALLRILDKDCSDVARWYAIETLLAHHVSVPLVKDVVT